MSRPRNHAVSSGRKPLAALGGALIVLATFVSSSAAVVPAGIHYVSFPRYAGADR